MPKLRLLAAASLTLALAGCHHTRSSRIAYTLTPSDDAVTVTCNHSSSDKCHFAFAGPSTPSLATIDVGSTITIKDIPVGTEFCAESHAVTLDNCSRSRTTGKTQNVEKRSSTTHPETN
jgi:hypothetical protein